MYPLFCLCNHYACLSILKKTGYFFLTLYPNEFIYAEKRTMKLYISIVLTITLLICCTSCEQNNNTAPPINKEIPKQNDTDSLNAKNTLNELVQKIAASSIYNQYDSLRTVLNFEKRIAYDEYLMIRKQNNNAEIIALLNNNNMALAKKRRLY
ncbi:MAG: hypothetical protein WDM90_16545 [Ferruginibacter sp.]